jgi:hypothetical protein
MERIGDGPGNPRVAGVLVQGWRLRPPGQARHGHLESTGPGPMKQVPERCVEGKRQMHSVYLRETS